MPEITQHASTNAGSAPISLCMIVKDEERFLRDCLASVASLVQELVIVDTGSADRTVEIARSFNARVFDFQWTGDFSQARNFGLQHATQPWILYLDADERLHAPHHEKIRHALKSNRADAYYIRVHSKVNHVLGNVPHVQGYPRLFRRMPGVYFTGRIHEQITPSLRQQNGRFALLDAEIEHLGYDLSEEEIAGKIRRNLAALREQVADEPDNVYARFQLGQTLILHNEIEEGKGELQAALDTNKLTDALASTAILILANEAFKSRELDTAVSLIGRALEKTPAQQLGWFLLSECLAAQKQYAEAIEALKKLKQHRHLKYSDIAVDKVFDEHLIEQRLGLYYFLLKAYPQASRHLGVYLLTADSYREGLLAKYLYCLQRRERSDPETERVFAHLVQHVDRFDDVQEAIRDLASYFEGSGQTLWQERVLKRGAELYPGEAVYPYYLGNNHLGRSAFTEAEHFFRRALKIDGRIYEVHYNLAVALIKQKKYDAAIEVIRDICRRFPEHRAHGEKLLQKLQVKVSV